MNVEFYRAYKHYTHLAAFPWSSLALHPLCLANLLRDPGTRSEVRLGSAGSLSRVQMNIHESISGQHKYLQDFQGVRGGYCQEPNFHLSKT